MPERGLQPTTRAAGRMGREKQPLESESPPPSRWFAPTLRVPLTRNKPLDVYSWLHVGIATAAVVTTGAIAGWLAHTRRSTRAAVAARARATASRVETARATPARAEALPTRAVGEHADESTTRPAALDEIAGPVRVLSRPAGAAVVQGDGSAHVQPTRRIDPLADGRRSEPPRAAASTPGEPRTRSAPSGGDGQTARPASIGPSTRAHATAAVLEAAAKARMEGFEAEHRAVQVVARAAERPPETDGTAASRAARSQGVRAAEARARAERESMVTSMNPRAFTEQIAEYRAELQRRVAQEEARVEAMQAEARRQWAERTATHGHRMRSDAAAAVPG
ncbi:hypothetical protein [Piscinibacter koreensis]|uniref:Uncharacterized protein n=1 Tax=Piscinibacter koreensis TaxID=2742824 RepID=A0A7Y6NPR2_9BURK|nr:hypothetical protein [Schlegelella koreensis]NUZ07090.1 hypothetical protein [Schlegelella koreensis]